MSTDLSPDEITQSLRSGYSFLPRAPGVQEAARNLMRPIIQRMEGQEIIYVCRFPRLMRVSQLEVNDKGFSAVGVPLQNLEDRPNTEPLDFSSPWDWLRMIGSSIQMNMVTDHFYCDPEIVAKVKAYMAQNDKKGMAQFLYQEQTSSKLS